MGVYEDSAHQETGMHWQQDRQQMLATAYDPSRDLSPNLPTLSGRCNESSMTSFPNGPICGGGVSSRISEYCSFKREYEQENYQGISQCREDCRGCVAERDANSNCERTSESGDYCMKSCGQVGRETDDVNPYQTVLVEPKQEAQRVESSDVKENEMCAGCGSRIRDRFLLLACDRRWHATCLQCCQCRSTLESDVTCFTKDGNIYCRKDYHRLFRMQRRCSRCQASISSSELVMRAKDYVFHIHCFSCVVCSTVLTKGAYFGMRDSAVFCRLHYQELPPGPPSVPPTPTPEDHYDQYPSPFPSPSSDYHPRLHNLQSSPLPNTPSDPVGKVESTFFNGAPTPRQKGRPRKRKPKDLEAMSNLDLNSETYLDVAFCPGTPSLGNGSHHQRTKRMRTSFKHHQLRTMKSYFAINHNPDAKDLKQLSQKTGLPKRVLQVWFQNARAKWRRMIVKQEGGSNKSGDKSDSSNSALDTVYHHSVSGISSPQHYLSSSPLECSS